MLAAQGQHAAALFADAWGWREMFQRAMDGCHSTDDMSAQVAWHYDDLEGPNLPLPCGYQARKNVRRFTELQEPNLSVIYKARLSALHACGWPACCSKLGLIPALRSAGRHAGHPWQLAQRPSEIRHASCHWLTLLATVAYSPLPAAYIGLVP